MTDDTEWTWEDVDRLLSDLKADGYDPTLVATVTSAVVPEKKIQINVARSDADGDRVCSECGDQLATDREHGWVCLTCNEPRGADQ